MIIKGQDERLGLVKFGTIFPNVIKKESTNAASIWRCVLGWDELLPTWEIFMISDNRIYGTKVHEI